MLCFQNIDPFSVFHSIFHLSSNQGFIPNNNKKRCVLGLWHVSEKYLQDISKQMPIMCESEKAFFLEITSVIRTVSVNSVPLLSI